MEIEFTSDALKSIFAEFITLSRIYDYDISEYIDRNWQKSLSTFHELTGYYITISALNNLLSTAHYIRGNTSVFFTCVEGDIIVNSTLEMRCVRDGFIDRNCLQMDPVWYTVLTDETPYVSD